MATILWPHGVQVSLFGHDVRGDELLHVFHVSVLNAIPTVTDTDAVCVTVNNWVGSGTNDYASLLPTTTFVDRVVATSVAEVNGAQSTRAVGVPGILTDRLLPSSVSLCLKKAGISRGRSRRGRVYLWAPDRASLDTADSNLFDATYVTRAVDAWNQLLADLGTRSSPMVIASQVDGLLHLVSTFQAVDSFVDSQRRRLAGRGR